MELTLTINGLDVHKKISTYQVTYEIFYPRIITTLDNVEHAAPGNRRPIITFSLLPMTEHESNELYLSMFELIFPVLYTDPYLGADVTKRFRLASDLDSVFALLSIDGKRRYKGEKIQLRAL